MTPQVKLGITANQKHDSEKISCEKIAQPDGKPPLTPTFTNLYYIQTTYRPMVSELIKLGILITLLMFIVPILLVVTFWCLANLASGNIFPFLFFLITALWAISSR